jgi:hypothetical protein
MLDFLVLIDEVWIAARMLVNHDDAPFTDNPQRFSLIPNR